MNRWNSLPQALKKGNSLGILKNKLLNVDLPPFSIRIWLFNCHHFLLLGRRINDIMRVVISHVFVMCFRRLYFTIYVLSLNIQEINNLILLIVKYVLFFWSA